MASLSADDSRLHTADTAADDGDLLFLLCRLKVILLGLHGLGVESTSRESHSIGKILSICVSLGGREVKAACVTADARLDVLKSVLNKLCDPLGINEELTCNANGVYSALGNCLSAHLGVHSSRADHGNINELLDVSNVVKVTVLGHIHRRMRPIPRVVGTVISVEHIVARVLKILCRSLGLCHGSSYLNVVLARHRALAKSLHLGLYRVAQRNGIVLSTRFLDSLNYLSGEAVTVLKASAVFVGALIEEFYRELVKQVALVYGVYLNAVNARLLTKLRGLCESLDYLVYLLDSHLGAFDVVCPSRRLRRGRCELVRGVYDRLDEHSCKFILMERRNQLCYRPGASHSCGKLNEKLCSRLMYLVHKDLKLLEHLLVLPEPLSPEGVAQRRDAGNYKSYVVIRSLKEELCSFLIEVAARKLKPTEKRGAAHRTHNYSVLYLYVADLPRGKQSIILGVHTFLL